MFSLKMRSVLLGRTFSVKEVNTGNQEGFKNFMNLCRELLFLQKYIKSPQVHKDEAAK